MSLRILIVDDHPLARSAVRTALGLWRRDRLEIDEAADGATAIELARRLVPDLVTMDIGLPDMSGLDVTRRLRRDLPGVKVVVISAYPPEEARDEALAAGAMGYVAKERMARELPAYLDRLLTRPAG